MKQRSITWLTLLKALLPRWESGGGLDDLIILGDGPAVVVLQLASSPMNIFSIYIQRNEKRRQITEIKSHLLHFVHHMSLPLVHFAPFMLAFMQARSFLFVCPIRYLNGSSSILPKNMLSFEMWQYFLLVDGHFDDKAHWTIIGRKISLR